MNRSLYILSIALTGFMITAKGQKLSEDEMQFLQKNVQTVCTDESMANANWKSLDQAIKNKRIILIGEFSHGAKEVFQLRNDLIRYLHKEHGYNTILFEAGIGEMILPDLRKKEWSASQMTNGLFGVWRTREFRDLMDYIKSENISIAGFDVQRSGNSFRRLLHEVAAKKNIDTILYHDLENRFGAIITNLNNRKAIYDSVAEKTKKLMNDYLVIYNKLFEKNPDSIELLLSLRTITNRIEFLRYSLEFVKDRDWNKSFANRDKAMADNIVWLIENVYKNEKLIIIGHNYHIAKFNENEEVMGEFLSKTRGDKMYSIGTFGGDGSFANNAGKEEKMKPADSLSLDIKHIVNSTNGFASYLTIPQQKSQGSEWLHKDIVVNDSFVDIKNTNKLVLAKHFDGLLFIRKISLPEK